MDAIIKMIKLGFFFTVDDNSNIKYEYIKPGGDKPPSPDDIKALLLEIKENRNEAIPYIKRLVKYSVENDKNKNDIVESLLQEQHKGRIEWIKIYVKSDASKADFIGVHTKKEP
jgi:ferritin-like protein